jgi:hypothetical protein
MRKIAARWAWPAVTFLLIGGFMVLAVLVRGGLGTSDADTSSPSAISLEPAQHVNTREWRTIASDPAGHADARVVVWGRVTSYDPAADPSSFRANVDSARHIPRNGTVNYPTPVVVHADPSLLQHLATGYIFKAEATVNAQGGSRPDGAAAPGGSVPELTATQLTVTDKTVG